MSLGASDINGSRAGKCEHIYNILFKAFLDFFFKSSLLSGNLYTANKWLGTSASAIALEWSAEWPPIYPKLHAAAAFTKSSGSFIRASFNGAIPLAAITPIANDSSNADIYPSVIIPGNLALPLASLI